MPGVDINGERLGKLLRLYAASEQLDYKILADRIGISATVVSQLLRLNRSYFSEHEVAKILEWILMKEKGGDES